MTIIFLLFFTFYFLFIWKAGKAFPLLYLMLFIYFVQYIFSVYLIYNAYPVLGKQMTIGQDRLFEYEIPALLFLFSGVFLFNKDINIAPYVKKIDPRQAAQLGHLLLFISFFFELLSAMGFPGISSLLSFTYFLRYIGVMCYLFSPSLLSYVLIVIVYLTLVSDTLRGGVFLNLLMWSSYLFFVAAFKFNLSFSSRSAFILLAVPLLVTIQSVKGKYRKATWSGKRETGVQLFKELANESAADDSPFQNSDGVISTVGRLNQGWHLGMVLKRVPQKEPFSNGEDFLSDLEGILLPRIFFPEKKATGSQGKFEKFTGHKLIGRTSMTIGVLGDFYVNFGRWGSFVGLFIFGSLTAVIFRKFIERYVLNDPINIIWLPFVFSFFIRAGNDFYMVANSTFKGFLIFLFIDFVRKQLWPVPPNMSST
jgi:hypothetical protein